MSDPRTMSTSELVALCRELRMPAVAELARRYEAAHSGAVSMKAMAEQAWKERDAAIARAERAERSLKIARDAMRPVRADIAEIRGWSLTERVLARLDNALAATATTEPKP